MNTSTLDSNILNDRQRSFPSCHQPPGKSSSSLVVSWHVQQGACWLGLQSFPVHSFLFPRDFFSIAAHKFNNLEIWYLNSYTEEALYHWYHLKLQLHQSDLPSQLDLPYIHQEFLSCTNLLYFLQSIFWLFHLREILQCNILSRLQYSGQIHSWAFSGDWLSGQIHERTVPLLFDPLPLLAWSDCPAQLTGHLCHSNSSCFYDSTLNDKGFGKNHRQLYGWSYLYKKSLSKDKTCQWLRQ